MQFLGGEKHLQRPGFSDEPWKTLRASPARNEPERCATMAKDGVWAGGPTTARKSQVETAAHTVAVNRRDGGGREVGYCAHQVLSHVREAKRFGAAQVGDFVEVGSGREEVSIARDDEFCRRPLCELLDCFRQRGDARAGEAVGSVGREKAQNSNAAMGLEFAQLFRRWNGRIRHRAD